MSRSDSEPVYGIGALARLLGTTPATLRAWEERYGVISPVRSPSGQRLYSRDEVEQLRFVLNLMESGLAAADAHRALALHLDEGVAVAPSSAPGSAPRVSILLAERDVYAAELIEYLLRTEGYDVLIALDAGDALALFEARQPDLVFVELVISGGIGVQLCRQLSASGARVVAVSTLLLGESAIEAGAEAFLQKPLDHLQVLSTVKDLLGTSQLARQATLRTRP
jgi:DNA-binding transcriptional MerR regulator